MSSTPPPTFCVSEIVNVLTEQAKDRTPWRLIEVTTSPGGESAHVVLLVEHYDKGPIRLDVSVSGGWIGSAR